MQATLERGDYLGAELRSTRLRGGWGDSVAKASEPEDESVKNYSHDVGNSSP